MGFFKTYKFELITFFVFSALSVFYYIETGQVKIMGALVLAVISFSAFIRLCKAIFIKYRAKYFSDIPF